MADLWSLVAASLLAGALTLIGLMLYRWHRKVGMLPLVAYLGLLAALTVLGQNGSEEGATLSASIVVVPAFIGLGLVVQGTLGQRAGFLAAALPAMVGILVGALTLASHVLPSFLPAALVADQAHVP
ncbi:MAG: hypothetical protein R3185_06715, partial [Candidatus Thermoplasmatota archaeon]|nr:hypothetical protein [Candidatus Thermoplasmatota archaeon]